MALTVVALKVILEVEYSVAQYAAIITEVMLRFVFHIP